MKAHGVPWLIRHLAGEITLAEAAEGGKNDTRRYHQAAVHLGAASASGLDLDGADRGLAGKRCAPSLAPVEAQRPQQCQERDREADESAPSARDAAPCPN
jgi:hypothetical protein